MALNITLANDDIRVKFPAYGLDMTNPLSIGRFNVVDIYGIVVEDRYCINGKWYDKSRLLLNGEFSKYVMTLDCVKPKS